MNDDVLKEVRDRLNVVESSNIVFPKGSEVTDLLSVIKALMDRVHILQTSRIHKKKMAIIVLGKALGPHDSTGFLNDLIDSYMETSVSIDGYRSEQITEIAKNYYHGVMEEIMKDKKGDKEKLEV